MPIRGSTITDCARAFFTSTQPILGQDPLLGSDHTGRITELLTLTRMADLSRIWIPRVGESRDAPVKAGIRRALVQMCPPIANDILPARMEAAMQALVELEPAIWGNRLAGSAR